METSLEDGRLRSPVDDLILLFFFVLLGIFFLFISLACFAQNPAIDPSVLNNSDDLGSGGAMTTSRWGMVSIAISIWIFPIPIARKKERYGKSSHATYWKWVAVLMLTSLIGLGVTGEPWMVFFSMLGMTCLGFLVRSKDEFSLDIAESVQGHPEPRNLGIESGRSEFTDPKFDAGLTNPSRKDGFVSGVIATSTPQGSEKIAITQEASSRKKGMVFMISGQPHQFNGKDFERLDLDEGDLAFGSNLPQSLPQKNASQIPQPYKGGMVFMISGSPHQFNGTEFERVDTDESVVINGKKFVWNGSNFVVEI